MENLKEVEQPEKWGRLRNLENYPNILYRKLERMEAMGLLDDRQIKEYKDAKGKFLLEELKRDRRDNGMNECCGSPVSREDFCSSCGEHC